MKQLLPIEAIAAKLGLSADQYEQRNPVSAKLVLELLKREAHMQGDAFTGTSKAGVNWENVSKRILPQLIYKGHVLRRERLCKKGLFFVCPTPVYEKIRGRLGGTLLEYALQPGSLTSSL